MSADTAEHRVVVAGRAERKVAPDRATWSFTVEAGASSERDAFDECSRRSNELMERLRELVGDAGEVSTQHVWTSPRWDSARSRYIGHRAEVTIRVDSPTDLASQVASVAMERSGVRVHGPYLVVSEAERIKDELMADAVAAARQKAERLAEAAGRQAGRVLFVREGSIEQGGYGGEVYGTMTLSDSAAPAAPEIAARESTISADVVVAVELADVSRPANL